MGSIIESMAYLVAVAVGLMFGGGDQYLGSLTPYLTLGSWTLAVSGMSAPWLVLPFAFGWSQVRPGRAMLLGLVATQSALVGYFALTLSPLEGVPLSGFPAGLHALLLNGGPHGANAAWVVAGLVTGPLYGLLGQRWRVHRSWISATLVTGALCLEPFARHAVGQLPPPSVVWDVEVVMGGAVAACFVIATLAHRRASQPPSAPLA
jgi:hypothetical protein